MAIRRSGVFNISEEHWVSFIPSQRWGKSSGYRLLGFTFILTLYALVVPDVIRSWIGFELDLNWTVPPSNWQESFMSPPFRLALTAVSLRRHLDTIESFEPTTSASEWLHFYVPQSTTSRWLYFPIKWHLRGLKMFSRTDSFHMLTPR